MIYVCRPRKVGIYINTGYKTPAAIKKETGCDAIINGGLYDMASFRPRCWLKREGRIITSDQWNYWGFGWDKATLTMDSTANIGKYQNYLACVAMLRNGKPEEMIYPAELGGRRGRSAIGVLANGDFVMLCTADGSAYAMTPEQCREEMRNCGCVSALMLDGGGSSQCITPVGSITSPRIVQNLICVWTHEDTEQKCPFAEPTRNVGRWCFLATKDMNRWVQWQLNRNGADLDVDGVFGKLSDAALRAFQRAHGLTADGICGKLTREALKQ